MGKFSTKIRKCLNIYRGHKAGVCQLDINPYDLFIMSGDETGEIIQWDLRKGGILKRFNSIENVNRNNNKR